MIPLIKNMAPAFGGEANIQPLWWCLSLGACLGGNGTLIGASANVAVTGLAEKDGKRISFNEFMRYGARVTTITLMMSSIYLVLWLYVGSATVNIAGAAVLALLFAVRWIRR